LEELRHLQERDTLNENHNSHLLKMNFMNDDALHPKNPITYIFNVEISPLVCLFCHGFKHLLVSCPERFSQIEIQPSLLVAFPPRNPPIITTLNYPNIVPRNSDSHSLIKGDKGEFIGF